MWLAYVSAERCSSAASSVLLIPHRLQHFGDLVNANMWMDRCMGFFDHVLAEPNQASEAFVIMFFLFIWSSYATQVGRGEQCLQAFSKVNCTWSNAEDYVDTLLEPVRGMVRARGDKTAGQHLLTTEYASWMYRFRGITMAAEPGVSADELADTLPSIEDMIWMANAGLPSSWVHTGFAGANLFVAACEACEKLGLHELALEYAEHATTTTDLTKGGCILPSEHFRAHCCKGRCLAALGKAHEAEAALEAALACVESLPGYTLQRVLALGDLKVHVLDKDGRGAEGSARLKVAIHQMLGESPAAEQLAELAPALGGAIDLAAVLA